MHPDSQTKPAPKETIQEISIDQELFLIDSKDANCPVHCLNSGATIVWLLCDGTRDVESIAGEIADTFGQSNTEAMTKVRKAVDQFQALGLLEP